MTFEIMSDGAVAQIDSKGAELISLKDIFGTEYIWQADKKYWGRHSPILFPVIGEQKNGSYEYDGKIYHISRHGFARDMEFDLIHHERERLLFSLSSNENTLKSYPFEFRFQVSYELENTVLKIMYRVQNIGNTEMLFNIGGHTAYNVPLVETDSFEDYYIEFAEHECFDRMFLNNSGIYTGEKQFFIDGKTFALNHSLFENDAIVPDKLKSKAISLLSRKSGCGVRVNFPDFDNLAIWSPKGEAPFVCLEPWNGRASSICDDNKLSSKYGIIKLKPNTSYDAYHSISLL